MMTLPVCSLSLTAGVCDEDIEEICTNMIGACARNATIDVARRPLDMSASVSCIDADMHASCIDADMHASCVPCVPCVPALDACLLLRPFLSVCL
jgi:hypothetical protein